MVKIHAATRRGRYQAARDLLSTQHLKAWIAHIKKFPERWIYSDQLLNGEVRQAVGSFTTAQASSSSSSSSSQQPAAARRGRGRVAKHVHTCVLYEPLGSSLLDWRFDQNGFRVKMALGVAKRLAGDVLRALDVIHHAGMVHGGEVLPTFFLLSQRD